jgi:hypothetical protein
MIFGNNIDALCHRPERAVCIRVGQRPMRKAGQRPAINSTGQRPVLAMRMGCRLKAYHQKSRDSHLFQEMPPCVFDARLTALKSFIGRYTGRCPVLLMTGLRPGRTKNLVKNTVAFRAWNSEK